MRTPQAGVAGERRANLLKLPSLAWLSGGAYSQPANYGRLLQASRVARPSSLQVLVWAVAMGSLAICGDAGGGIKPRRNDCMSALKWAGTEIRACLAALELRSCYTGACNWP